MARSRFTAVPAAYPPAMVRSKVVPITSTAKVSWSASTAVRHAPSTAIESPGASSPAKAGASTTKRRVVSRSSTRRIRPVLSMMPVNITSPSDPER